MNNPGGLVRAEIAFESAVIAGLPERACEMFACAVEYFHSASLIFDDLPSMDDASERRGRICCHLLHGEGYAILGSLSLITRAYALLGEVIAATPGASPLAAHRLAEACLGTSGLVNGQAEDLSYQYSPRRPHAGSAVALRKTAPLLRFALTLPVVLTGGWRADERALRALSVYWGLLYQGVDDLIDETLPTAESGKTAGRDAWLGRPTAVRELGLAGTVRYLTRLLRLADHRLVILFDRNCSFHFLARFQESFRRRVDVLASRLPATPRTCP